jgi:hypothetical protein
VPFARKPRESLSDKTIDAHICRAIERQGLRVCRSRWRLHAVDDYGGWQLIEPRTNTIIACERFELNNAQMLAHLEDE